MSDNPYERFNSSDLILRDELAIDRTILANERTFLAYCRTALTLLIAGLTLFHFIPSGYLRIIGIVFIPVGIIVGIYGLIRFVQMKKKIESIRKKYQ